MGRQAGRRREFVRSYWGLSAHLECAARYRLPRAQAASERLLPAFAAAARLGGGTSTSASVAWEHTEEGEQLVQLLDRTAAGRRSKIKRLTPLKPSGAVFNVSDAALRSRSSVFISRTPLCLSRAACALHDAAPSA